MTKADPVEHEGYEVPNWLTKCKAIMTQGPVLGIIAIAIVVLGGLTYWNHSRPAYSRVTQTQPDTSVTLPVTQSNTMIPSSVPATTLPSLGATANGEAETETSSADTPIGPAPSDSLQNLQPASEDDDSNSQGHDTSRLTRALPHPSQKAGNAGAELLRNLGL